MRRRKVEIMKRFAFMDSYLVCLVGALVAVISLGVFALLNALAHMQVTG
jgi:hypothetical protein